MARARNIKPGFFKNEQLVEHDFGTRLLFIGLWTLADREGRLEDRPKRIKMELFPADDYNVEKGLNELAKSGFIQRYTVGEARYILIINFLRHQNPHHREPPSTIPEPQASPGLDGDAKGSKPEVLTRSLSNESPGPAPGETQARPEQARGEPQESRADSLIPDSLIPDSLIPERSAHAPPSGGNGTKRGRVCATLRAAGVSVTAGNPLLVQWVEDGVTDEHLTEAVARARDRKPPPAAIPAAYFDPILREVMSQKPNGVKRHVAAVPETDFSKLDYSKGF